LQTALSVAVNVITLIQPTPEECVSPGVKSSNGPRSRELQGRGRHLQVLSAGLPHPQRHADFLPDEYRMREVSSEISFRAGMLPSGVESPPGSAAVARTSQLFPGLRSCFCPGSCKRYEECFHNTYCIGKNSETLIQPFSHFYLDRLTYVVTFCTTNCHIQCKYFFKKPRSGSEMKVILRSVTLANVQKHFGLSLDKR
jgi:hypothetical protein